jgi:MFS family permease
LNPAQRRVLLASLVGSAIEWFDFFLYGTAAGIVFSRLFFPAADPLVSLLLAYLSFAVPFFIRPFGGIAFAHFGDRVGRKRTLILTLTLMGAGTTLIGLLPTYQEVGIFAPLMLVLLRIVQGLGLGGEWGGAVLLAFEYSPDERKGLFASVPQVGVPIGMLLSSLCVALASQLPEEAFLGWGWRVPFVLSAGLVVLGLWIRGGIDETPDFKSLQATGQVARYPFVELLRSYRRRVFAAVLVKLGETSSFYIFAVFVIGYASQKLGFARDVTLLAVACGALVCAPAILLCGVLADRLGRRRVFAAGSIGIMLFAAPYFWLLSQRSVPLLFVATIVAIGVIWPLVTATLSTLLAETFPAHVRYSGITFGYQIGAALVGGTAPLIATLLLSVDHGRWRWIAAFIALSSAISFAAAAPITRAVAVHNQGHSSDAAARNDQAGNAAPAYDEP